MRSRANLLKKLRFWPARDGSCRYDDILADSVNIRKSERW